MKTFRHTQTYKSVAAGIALLVAIGLVTYSLQTYWRDHQLTQGAAPARIPTETVTYTTSEPDETPPDCPSYRVADSEPRKIKIESLGIDGCIQKVGIDQNNAIAAPTNVHLAGWYTKTVPPGQKGVSLIDGHVSGRYGEAIFTKLGSIKTGDIIHIQLGDGSWKAFETVDVTSYPSDDVMEHLFDSLNDIDSQLTLITCAGTYDKQAMQYSNREVVRARLMP